MVTVDPGLPIAMGFQVAAQPLLERACFEFLVDLAAQRIERLPAQCLQINASVQ